MKSQKQKKSTEKPTQKNKSQKAKTVSLDDALKLAIEHHQSGRLDKAEKLYRKILHLRQDHFISLSNLGVALNAQGKVQEAIACFIKAIAIKPDDARVLYDLGRAFNKTGQISKAITCFKKAITIKPDFSDAFSVLSNALRSQHDLKGALNAAKKALTINPAHGEAWLNLGNIFYVSSRLDKAISCYRRALKIRPDYVEAYMNMGMALNKQGKQDQAVSCFQKAMEINPTNFKTCATMVNILKVQGKFEEASRCYEHALTGKKDWTFALWDFLHLLPIVYENEADISIWRKRFEKNLHRLEESLQLETKEDVDRAFAAAQSGTNYFLAYQEQDDKDLQKRYGRLIHRVASERFPALTSIPARGRGKKLRVGYVSFNFYGHTIAKLFGGWIKAADRNRFTVYSYYLGRVFDPANKIIEKWSDVYRHLPALNLDKAAAAIRNDRLDVLVYPDVGMEPFTLLLSALRLAPVQCASWGHPVTTGLPTMDYFLSSDLMEQAEAGSHYSEKLVRLPNLSVYYQRPGTNPASGDRSHFGFEQNHVIYLCCQFLSKYLPQYDIIFPRIALEVPSARFVFIAHKTAFVTDRFRSRLDRVFRKFGLDFRNHCVFFSRLPPKEFFSLNLATDVYLDTIGWSGGNTTFDAAACGLPVVTLPGSFMRGRHAYAMLKRMEITETIASTIDEYVDIAARLGRDEEYRRAMKKGISTRSDCLFNDLTAVRGLEEFYESVS